MMGQSGGDSSQTSGDVQQALRDQQDIQDEKDRQARLKLASQGSGTSRPAWEGGFGGGGQAQQGTPTDASIGFTAAGGGSEPTGIPAQTATNPWNSSQWSTGQQGKAGGDQGGAFPAPKTAYPKYGGGYSANWWD